MIWAEDIATEKVLEKTEYFVYCGFFKRNFWGERFVQITKGEFLEVPCSLLNILIVGRGYYRADAPTEQIYAGSIVIYRFSSLV